MSEEDDDLLDQNMEQEKNNSPHPPTLLPLR